MEVAHRKFGNDWGQFDRYCKLVLYHEAIDYLRELQRKSDHEKPLDTLSPEEWDKPAIIFNGKAIATTLFGVLATVVFGVGMCMTMVWNMMVLGIVIGIVGIVLLLCLIPICKGLK